MFSMVVPIFGANRLNHFKYFLESFASAAYTPKIAQLVVVEMVPGGLDPKYDDVRKFIHSWKHEYVYSIYHSEKDYERSTLLNEGVHAGDREWVVFHDVDVPLPEDFFVRLKEQATLGKAQAFSNFKIFLRMLKEDTDMIMGMAPKMTGYSYRRTLKGGKWEDHGAGWTKLSCTMSRKLWEEVGGWHEGFKSWGLEDDEMSRRLEHLGHAKTFIPLSLHHLWHPLTSPNWKKSEENQKLYARTLAEPGKVIHELKGKSNEEGVDVKG